MSSVITKVLIFGSLLYSFSSCKEEEKKTESTPDVNVVTAGKKDIPTFSEYVGQVYGLSDVNIDPRAQGWITGIFFKEGSLVQKGSLLYTIDDQPYINELDAAKAEVARMQTLMENKKSELGRFSRSGKS